MFIPWYLGFSLHCCMLRCLINVCGMNSWGSSVVEAPQMCLHWILAHIAFYIVVLLIKLARVPSVTFREEFCFLPLSLPLSSLTLYLGYFPSLKIPVFCPQHSPGLLVFCIWVHITPSQYVWGGKANLGLDWPTYRFGGLMSPADLGAPYTFQPSLRGTFNKIVASTNSNVPVLCLTMCISVMVGADIWILAFIFSFFFPLHLASNILSYFLIQRAL